MREEGNPLYNFLVDPDSMEGLYYRWRTYGECSYIFLFFILSTFTYFFILFKNQIYYPGLGLKFCLKTEIPISLHFQQFQIFIFINFLLFLTPNKLFFFFFSFSFLFFLFLLFFSFFPPFLLYFSFTIFLLFSANILGDKEKKWREKPYQLTVQGPYYIPPPMPKSMERSRSR